MNSHIAWGIKTTWDDGSSHIQFDIFLSRSGAIDNLFSDFLSSIPDKYRDGERSDPSLVFNDAPIAKDKRELAWKWLKRKYNFSIVRVELREIS